MVLPSELGGVPLQRVTRVLEPRSDHRLGCREEVAAVVSSLGWPGSGDLPCPALSLLIAQEVVADVIHHCPWPR